MRLPKTLHFSGFQRGVAALVAYGVGVGTAVWGVAFAVGILLEQSVRHDRGATVLAAASPAAFDASVVKPARPAEAIRQGGFVPTNDDWNERLRDPGFWAGKRKGGSSSPVNIWTPGAKQMLGVPGSLFEDVPPVTGRGWRSGGDTYRTVCVRLCDGSFVPVSFSTTRDRFEDDAEKCERTCQGGGARLFVYRNPGEEPEDMEDLNGQPYKKLPKAFAYKTTYDASCKCRPHPWEEVARDQHRVYALEAVRVKGDKAVVEEIKSLRDKIKTAELAVATARRTAEQQKADEAKRRAAEAKAAEAERIAARKREAAAARAAKSGSRITTAATAPPPSAVPPAPVGGVAVAAPAVAPGMPIGAIRVMRGNRSTIVGTRNDGSTTSVPSSGPFILRIPPQTPSSRPSSAPGPAFGLGGPRI